MGRAHTIIKGLLNFKFGAMFKRLEPKTRFVATATAFVAVMFLFGFGIVHYAVPKIVQESGVIEQTKISLAALEEQKNVALAEEEKIKPLSAKLDMIDAAIVPADNPVAFFKLLERLATYEHLSFEINPSSAQNAPPATIALTVAVTGALKQGIDFIKNIETFPFVLTVSDVTLSRSVTIASSETNQNTKTITPILGETTITMTLFAASRP